MLGMDVSQAFAQETPQEVISPSQTQVKRLSDADLKSLIENAILQSGENEATQLDDLKKGISALRMEIKNMKALIEKASSQRETKEESQSDSIEEDISTLKSQVATLLAYGPLFDDLKSWIDKSQEVGISNLSSI